MDDRVGMVTRGHMIWMRDFVTAVAFELEELGWRRRVSDGYQCSLQGGMDSMMGWVVRLRIKTLIIINLFDGFRRCRPCGNGDAWAHDVNEGLREGG